MTHIGIAQGTISSGTFQFTTDSYSISANEGSSPMDSSLAPSLLGARVTVTRSGGFSGRVQVPYSGAASGTLVFDDYQMSASILVTGAGTVTLGTPTLDPLESSELLPPTLGGTASETITVLDAGSNPTNSVINLERATFRVDKNTANAIIHVSRTKNGTPPTVPDVGVTVNYVINPIINTYLPQTGFAGNPAPGNSFALEAGSDYAVNGIDFIGTNTGTLTGVISFPANVLDETITIPITNSGLVDFNKDLQVALWIPFGSTEPALVGGVNKATLTILPDSSTPGLQPAGAVDRVWNKDNTDGFDSSPPYLKYPGTQGGVSGTANGNGGTVYAVVEQPDGKTVIAGSFISFDSNPYNRIVRLLNNGYQDPTFLVAPNSGANDVINAMALQPDEKIIVVGNFTAFNGVNRYHVARLNTNGSVDTTFTPGTGVNGPVYAVALQSNGQIIIGGSFTSVNGTNRTSVARLNSNGSLDASFNPGTGPDGVVNAVAVDAFGRVIIGGDFDSVAGSQYGGVARLNVDGSLDTTFISGIGTYNPNTGLTDPVYTLAMQGSQVLVGGSFAYMELASYNGLVRLNSDGTIDTTFNPGSGTYNPVTGQVDSIFVITLQPDGNILIGGDFTTYNQTRRVGIARLFSYGSVDTSFADTAYNQFAGLINHYHNPNAVSTNDYPQGNNRNFVCAIAVEPNSPNNVIIGGNFLRVGGGSVYHSGLYNVPNAPNTPRGSGMSQNERMDIHPRSNVARLIGGGTPGPGNISLTYGSYSVDKSAGTLYVSISRTNGSLGVISAKCSPEYGTPGAGIATSNDVTGGAIPTWPTIYTTTAPPGNNSWMAAPGTFGANYIYDSTYGTGAPGTYPDVYFTIINDTNLTGNLNAKIDLSAPDGSSFDLGGEVIPLGAALGFNNLSPLTIIDTNIKPGVFGFSSPAYTVNQGNTAAITVTRTNGSDNTVQINYTATNGTAINPVNFTAVSGTLTFGPGIISQTFTVPTAAGTTTNTDRTVNLQLSSATSGGKISLTNAVLTIVNNTFANGHLAFTVTNFTANESAGTVSVTVNRLGGSTGTLDVTAVVGGATAVDGLNYIASTNALHWNNNDISVKTFSIPLIDDGIFTPNLIVNLRLTNGLANNTANGKVLGLSSITNATLTIVNVDFPGTVKFTSSQYSVKKYAGYAPIPVIRTGGSAQTVTVNFSTQNGSATSGVNYTATNGILTFTNGQVVQYLKVPIIDDGQLDGLLNLKLVLSNATPGISLGSPSNATLNIIDTASVDEPPGSTDITYSPFAGFNGNVNALALQPNNQLIVGGDFTMADGVPRYFLARLNSEGALDASFLQSSSTSGADNQVQALAIQTDGRIVVGGFFGNFNGVAQGAIARLNYDGSLDSMFNPGSGADNPVYALTQSPVDGKILVGGAFATIGGVTFNGIGRLYSDGTPDPTFNSGGLGAGSTGSSATVYAVAIQSDGKIIIGGDFTTFNGVTVNHLARLNTDGSLDAAFGAGTGANDSVRAIAIQSDGKILIGGRFTNYNTVALNHVARLNLDGTPDSSFTPGVGANDTVSSIALQSNGRIILGGQFTRCNGVTRNRITRLNPDGSADPTINFGSGANGSVAAVIVQEDAIQGYPTNVPDEKIIIGGGFNQYDGQPQANLARIFGGSESGSGAFGFSSASYQSDETNSFAFVTLVRSGGTSGTNADGSGDVRIPFAISDGTASNGVNYLSTITNVDFPAGEVEETILVPVLDDHLVTPNLTVNLAVNPLPPAEYGDQPTAVLTIINDDSMVAFSTATYQVPKNVVNGVAPINIVRIGSASGTASVIFSTTTGGTAVAGTDYTPVTNALLTFNPGVTNIVLTIPVINNNLPEGNRTVGMQLTGITGSSSTNPTNAVLTIIDTVNAPGQLAFSATNYNVNENGTTGYSSGIVTVVRTNGSTGNVSVNIATLDGSAVNGVDYFTTSGVLVFSDGQSSQNFAVQIVNTPSTSSKQFSVVLSQPTGGASFANIKNATITILNTNTEIAFSPATNSFTEPTNLVNHGSVSLRVVRFNNTNGVTTVNYSTTNGTAMAGVNFVGITNSILTFLPGISSTNIIVQTLYDPRYTGDLQFTVGLASPNNGAQLVSPSTAMVSDHDANALVSFLTTSNSLFSNAGSVPIYVIRSNTNGQPVSVNYSTVGGTATAGVDFTATSGTLTFANNQSTNVFNVPILSGTQAQSNKTFSVVLSAATGLGVLGYPSNELVTILWTNTVLSNPTVQWLGNAGATVWDTYLYNWLSSSNNYCGYADGDNVVFNDSCIFSTVAISGSVAPGNVTFANSTNVNYTLSGGSIIGPTGLVKANSGAVSLLSSNLYVGSTLINGGTLLVNNTNGSGTGTGAVIVRGGTLGGSGIIAGAVTVNAGGGFAPGNPLGVLTISNDLTLAAGATSYFQIRHSTLNHNTAAKVAGTLTEGGTLNVTKIGVQELAKGDSFTLFSAGHYTGAFANLILPVLSPGLGWSSNSLNTAGMLTVVVQPPVISSVKIFQGALVLQGGIGTVGSTFYLLSSTNVSAPMTNWTRLLTNSFDGNGYFNVTNLLNTTNQNIFFRLLEP